MIGVSKTSLPPSAVHHANGASEAARSEADNGDPDCTAGIGPDNHLLIRPRRTLAEQWAEEDEERRGQE